jgi:histidine triad (HIT) family protein
MTAAADCIFCRIAAGEIPARIVRRTKDAVAFHDLTPQAPVHLLIIPTRHHAAARDATGAEGRELLGGLVAFAAEVATELGLDATGYRLVTNTGPDAGQSVFHLHFHLMGGRKFAWPPG